MQELSGLESEVDRWRSLERRVEESAELLMLAQEEGATDFAEEIAGGVGAIERELGQMRWHLYMSGPHDAKDAIVSIHAGAGGTESQDWAEMLLRMYLRWAENKGFKTEILDQTAGEEAGLKSVTFAVHGRYAYGYLQSERGVHRLVRISPFDNASRRHTSFALAEVIPDIGEEIEIDIDEDELRIDMFRASGHGGQNVQKNSTAIRITHEPTGIVVQCQNERSQIQNRRTAMAILRARLYELEHQKQIDEQARLRGEHVSAGWGNQIRSYVLQPYRMVKDLRTDWQTGNTDAVLDGHLDELMQAYLEYSVGANRSR